MKKTLLPLLLTALSAQLAFAAPTTIAGIAKDGSNGNKGLAGVKVQLVRPGDKGAKTTIATAVTDAKGHFSFPAREYSPSELLMTNIDYRGFDYWAVAFDGGNKLKQVGINVNPSKVDLLVFNTSTQPVPLNYEVHHLAIKSIPTGINCIERIVVHNPTTFTFMGIGERKITMLLDIPKDAKNVKLDPKIADAKLVKTQDSGWGIVKPITPDAYGVRNAIIVSYDMDWPSSMPWAKTMDLSRKINYPTKFFFVARTTEDKALQVSAPKLSPDTEAPVPIDGQTETRIINSVGAPMAGGDMPPALPAGQELSITVSKPVNSTFWGFLAMTVALCLFLPLAMIKPRQDKRKDGRNAKFAEPSGNVLVSEQTSANGVVFSALNGFGTDIALTQSNRDLIQKIADLDDLREAGKIGEEEYQSRRAAWKKQLIESLGNPQQH